MLENQENEKEINKKQRKNNTLNESVTATPVNWEVRCSCVQWALTTTTLIQHTREAN